MLENRRSETIACKVLLRLPGRMQYDIASANAGDQEDRKEEGEGQAGRMPRSHREAMSASTQAAGSMEPVCRQTSGVSGAS